MSEELDMRGEETVVARRAGVELSVSELGHAEWERAHAVGLTRYWSGAQAPPGRHSEARLLWTPEAILARFVCRQTEPYVVSDAPQPERKTLGLWDRDVCELFLAPDARRPEHYFEFEAAPTGEWLDLELHARADGRETNWDYRSGMTTAARVGEDSFTLALRVPWSSLGPAAPRAGDCWRANLYRCVGSGHARGYLAWRPTETPRPNFHVPQKFGRLVFE